MEKRMIATWLTKKPSPVGFLTASLCVFLLVVTSTLIWASGPDFSTHFAAHRESVFTKGEWWRLFTALGAHADGGHLLSNSFLFFVFGLLLSGYWGLWVFPVMALLFGALTNAIVIGAGPEEIFLLGASGVVYWLGAVWITLYVLVNRQLSVFQRSLRGLGVAIMLFMPGEAFNPRISYRAHAVGFLLGSLFGVLYFAWRRTEIQAAEEYEVLPVFPEFQEAETPEISGN